MNGWNKPDWKRLEDVWWKIYAATETAISTGARYVNIESSPNWPGFTVAASNERGEISCYRYDSFNFPEQSYPENVLFTLWDDGFLDCSEQDLMDFLNEYARPISYALLRYDTKEAQKIRKAGWWGPNVRE